MPDRQIYMLNTIMEIIAVVAIASATPSPVFFDSEFCAILNPGLHYDCGAHYSSSCRAAKPSGESDRRCRSNLLLMCKHMNNMAI